MSSEDGAEGEYSLESAALATPNPTGCLAQDVLPFASVGARVQSAIKATGTYRLTVE